MYKCDKLSEESIVKIESYKYDFLKFFLGTFILGAAAACTTYIFKKFELKIQSRKEESAYLKPYLDKYLDIREKDRLDYSRALDMAEFISRTTTDEDLKTNWTDFRDFIIEKGNKIIKKNDSLKISGNLINESISKKQVKITIVS